MLVDTTYLEELKGQILQFNNPRDAFGAAMYYLGIDVNNPSEKDWKAVYGLLATQKDYVQGYVMDEIYNKMEKGEAWIAAYYAGDCLAMMGESADDVELGFYYPKNANGKPQTNVFADAMCIPTSANKENLELAYMYINFMLEPEIAYANAEYIYYGCPYDYTKLYDYIVFDENGKLALDENGLPIIDTELYEQNLEYVAAYKDNMGEDYDVIYDKDFGFGMENSTKLIEMFNEFAYKDLTHNYISVNGKEISNLEMLNDKWEDLKVASTSMIGIYIICLIIALALVAFVVYAQVVKRKRRKLYWAQTPTPRAKPKNEPNPDLSATQVVAIEKAKKRDDAQK